MKIALSYPGMIERILKSLDKYFSEHSDLKGCDFGNEDGYQLIYVSDIEHTVNIIIFYVLSKKYDVYNLAFKEFIG
jgi:hypothetical protein